MTSHQRFNVVKLPILIDYSAHWTMLPLPRRCRVPENLVYGADELVLLASCVIAGSMFEPLRA